MAQRGGISDGEETGDEGLADLIERLKTTLGDQVETVRTSQRLTDLLHV